MRRLGIDAFFHGRDHLRVGIPHALNRDKDQVLQENGCLVLRFLAEDVGRVLDVVLDAILRTLSHRQFTEPPVAPLSFVRRSQT